MCDFGLLKSNDIQWVDGEPPSLETRSIVTLQTIKQAKLMEVPAEKYNRIDSDLKRRYGYLNVAYNEYQFKTRHKPNVICLSFMDDIVMDWCNYVDVKILYISKLVRDADLKGYVSFSNDGDVTKGLGNKNGIHFLTDPIPKCHGDIMDYFIGNDEIVFGEYDFNEESPTRPVTLGGWYKIIYNNELFKTV